MLRLEGLETVSLRLRRDGVLRGPGNPAHLMSAPADVPVSISSRISTHYESSRIMLQPTPIDPARLERSRSLKCVRLSTYTFRVAGHRRDYTVDLRDRLFPRCECYDGSRHICKHSLAALRAAGEPSVLQALGDEVAPAPHPAAVPPGGKCACGQQLRPGDTTCIFCELGF
jgi:hypothetical protein